MHSVLRQSPNFNAASQPAKPGKVILRQCVACRKQLPRTTLLRVVFDRIHHQFKLLQPSQVDSRLFGRSAYLCPSEECLKMAIKGKKIHKALKTSIPDDILRCLNDLI